MGTILVWVISGPLFGYSDTWQLVINTGTTIVTFLMVFVIQNTQNRDTAAMHIKIDELIRVTGKARNILLDLEELDDKTLETLRTDYEGLGGKAKSRAKAPEHHQGGAEAAGPVAGKEAVLSVGEKEPSPVKGKGKVKPSLPKRFYKDVAVTEDGAGVALKLDGKPVRTPGKAPLVLPTRALADAVAEEWRAQGERIDPATMPLTKLANSAIDGVAGREPAVIDDIMSHAASDLVCYRAPGPPGLVEAQTKHWDPVLAWAKDTLGAPLKLGQGVVHVAQPQASLDRIRAGARRARRVQPGRAPCHDRADRLGPARARRGARASDAGGGVGGRPCR